MHRQVSFSVFSLKFILDIYADPEKAATELGWRAEFGIERMCADAWRWQSQNPDGYGDAE